MTAPKSVDPAGLLREQLESASPDLLRAMVKTFAEALMSAEADAICGAPYGQRSEDRTNQRNGYPAPGVGHEGRHGRAGDPETAAGLVLSGLVAAAPPAGRAGPRLGRGHLLSAWGVDAAGRSWSQVSEMAQYLDAQVEAFRNRPLDAGPYTFVWCD